MGTKGFNSMPHSRKVSFHKREWSYCEGRRGESRGGGGWGWKRERECMYTPVVILGGILFMTLSLSLLGSPLLSQVNLISLKRRNVKSSLSSFIINQLRDKSFSQLSPFLSFLSSRIPALPSKAFDILFNDSTVYWLNHVAIRYTQHNLTIPQIHTDSGQEPRQWEMGMKRRSEGHENRQWKKTKGL